MSGILEYQMNEVKFDCSTVRGSSCLYFEINRSEQISFLPYSDEQQTLFE